MPQLQLIIIAEIQLGSNCFVYTYLLLLQRTRSL